MRSCEVPWVLAVIVCACVGGYAGGACPRSDLNGDCRVDFSDLVVLGEDWLSTADSTADLNSDGDVNGVDLSLLAENWGEQGVPLLINEVLASNTKTNADPQGQYDDWIEIYNAGNKAIDLAGMCLTDDLSWPSQWRFPTGNPALTTIGSRGYLLVWVDNDIGDAGLHASFQIDADSDKIAIFHNDGRTLVDSTSFDDQMADVSYGRYPDGNDSWALMGFPTPGGMNLLLYEGFVAKPQFNRQRGFYDQPLSVAIASETEDATIYYTVDGSSPYDFKLASPKGTVYMGPVAIAKTTCLRAVACKQRWATSAVETHTYIFVNDVATQSPSGQAPGPGWPTGSVNGQMINYGMDPDVVNDPRYSSLIEDALLAIPTISLATDLANLFGSSTGIYVNARQQGRTWERPVSVELLNPDGSNGFQIDAGLRIRGGYSRSSSNPKHAFRLFFRPDYGAPELRFPLFGDEGVDEFESVDLRCSQNYSWSFEGNSSSSHDTFVREVFSRDTQRDMAQPYTRSRYYHLYIDGHYWGLYQTQERSEASYAESYFGGDKEEYDVVKSRAGNGGYDIEATDGTLDAWRRLWQAVSTTISNQTYYSLQGLNTDGTPNPAYEKLLDVDNLIDYMLCTYYVGDPDGPVSAWARVANNFYGIHNRKNPDCFKFFRHDAEHSLWDLNESRLFASTTTAVGSQFNQSNPLWMHTHLIVHPDYKMRFADRVYKYFFGGGVLTPAQCTSRFMTRKDQIDLAIIAESARWGDAKRSTPRTKDADWLPDMNRMVSSYFPGRTAVVLNQFKSQGWYPNVEPPTFSQNGGLVATGFGLTITVPTGTIWYTLDGSDPRLRGGSINAPSAGSYSGAIALTKSTHVKARVLIGSTWSALNEAVFGVGPVKENLRVTEIMYHPCDANNPADPNEEFIELKNIGPQTTNLNLVKFTNGIDFTFGDVNLAPGAFAVIVENKTAFQARYGTTIPIAGQYIGKLDNAGERIQLVDAVGTTILDFKYADGWRDVTDGEGYSLTIINPANPDANSWDIKDSWRASVYAGGSPGSDDSGLMPNPGDVVINEVLAHAHAEASDWIELCNTTGKEIDIGGWFLSDANDDLFKYEIAAGTKIPAYGYKVFYEGVNFGNSSFDPGKHVGFALSENGEKLYLTGALDGFVTGYRDTEEFGASLRDISFGRYFKKSTGTSNFVALSYNTPWLGNSYPKVGPIVISEIMYNPDWPVGGSYTNDSYEYVELRNITDAPVTLYQYDRQEGWRFTEGIEYQFAGVPNEVTIPAGGYIVVVRNVGAFSWRYPEVSVEKIYGPYTGALDNAGEKLELSMPGDVDRFGVRQWIRIDRVVYSDGSHADGESALDLWPKGADGLGSSLQRINMSAYGNDPNNWTASTTTPAR